MIFFFNIVPNYIKQLNKKKEDGAQFHESRNVW